MFPYEFIALGIIFFHLFQVQMFACAIVLPMLLDNSFVLFGKWLSANNCFSNKGLGAKFILSIIPVNLWEVIQGWIWPIALLA